MFSSCLSKFSFVTLILLIAGFTAGSYASPGVPSLQFLSINKVRAMILERNDLGKPVYNLRHLLMNALPDQLVFAVFEDEKWNGKHLFSIMNDEQLTCEPSHVSNDREQQPLGNFILEHVLGLDLKYIPNSLESLIKPILPCLTNLESLNLSGMNIGDNGAKFIANSKELQNLRYLNLDRNEIGDAGIIEIATKMNQLVSLSLAFNPFGLKGAIAIAKHLKNLEYLNVRYCYIGIQGGFEIASHFTQLRHLELGGNFMYLPPVIPFTNTDMTDKIVSHVVANMPELVHLHLDGYGLDDVHAITIASKLPHLKYLSLYQNQIGPIGANAIATELKELEFLDLSENPIGDEGAIAIAHHMKNLQKLHLSRCKIGDKGAIAIAGLDFKIMTYLELNHNRFGDEGAIAIASNENVKYLSYLSLNFNRISKDVATEIKERLKNHVDVCVETYD